MLANASYKNALIAGTPRLFIEFISVASIASIMMFLLSLGKSFNEIIPVGIDWLYIMVLGVFCTAIAFLLGTEVLKKLSPFTVSISINLEPVYAILLALWIFGDSEVMSFEFYIGASIILATIVANAFLKSKESV